MFNHAYTFAFCLESKDAEGLDVTADMIREALRQTLDRIPDCELLENVGAPFDTYELDEEPSHAPNN